jgi:hypothetical protein
LEGEDLWLVTLETSSDLGAQITWSLGGTLPGSSFVPYAFALVIEEQNPVLAGALGRRILHTLIWGADTQ